MVAGQWPDVGAQFQGACRVQDQSPFKMLLWAPILATF